jgi:hypothetical protein
VTDPAEPEATSDADADAGQGGEGAGGLVYGDVHGFVEGWFAPTISRPLGGTHRWCPTWWDHPEAKERLDALWRAYEHLQDDHDLGPITFLNNHLDPTLQVLLAPTGPFARCTPDRHEPHQPLPLNPQPRQGNGPAEPPAAASPYDLPGLATGAEHPGTMGGPPAQAPRPQPSLGPGRGR